MKWKSIRKNDKWIGNFTEFILIPSCIEMRVFKVNYFIHFISFYFVLSPLNSSIKLFILIHQSNKYYYHYYRRRQSFFCCPCSLSRACRTSQTSRQSIHQPSRRRRPRSCPAVVERLAILLPRTRSHCQTSAFVN